MPRILRSFFLLPLAIALPALEGVALATVRPAIYRPVLVVDETYERGETVRVVLKNEGTVPVFVARANPCVRSFTIHDDRGFQLPIEEATMCIMMVAKPLEVAPGASETLGTWDQTVFDRCGMDRCSASEVLEGRYEVRANVAPSMDGQFAPVSAFFWIGYHTNTILEVTNVTAPTTALVGKPVMVHIDAVLPNGMAYDTADIQKSVLQIECFRAPCYSPTTVTIALLGRPGGEGGRIGIDLDLQPLDPGRVTLRVLSGNRGVRTSEIAITEFPTFPDVPDTHWAWRAIGLLADEGVLRGHDDGQFHPQWNITRAEVAKIALLASRRSVTTGLPNPFTDLSEQHSLRDALLTALANNYLDASGTVARPDARATRFETLKALMDAFGQTPTIALDLAPAFPDAASGEAAAYSTEAKRAGIISGNDGQFLPNDPITRAEVAKIVAGLMHLM